MTDPKKPTHRAYIVTERGEGKKADFLEIGAAWPNADGKGFNLVLKAAPLDGRLTLRVIEEKAEKPDSE